MRRRIVFALFIVVTVMSLVGVWVVESAHATYHLDPNDPKDSGCWDGQIADSSIAKKVNATALRYNGIWVADIYNWYSFKCKTNWVEIVYRTDMVNGTFIDIHPQGMKVAPRLGTRQWKNNTRVDANAGPQHQCYPTDCLSWYKGRLSPSWSNMIDGTPVNCIYAGISHVSAVLDEKDGTRITHSTAITTADRPAGSIIYGSMFDAVCA